MQPTGCPYPHPQEQTSMPIFYLSLGLLVGSALYNYGDEIQAAITSIWAKIWASDDPSVLFTAALCTWAAGVCIYYWVVEL